MEKNNANKKFKKLNDLFKSDINGFWKSVKKMRQLKTLINVPINKIEQIYKSLFNTENIINKEKDEKEETEVNDVLEEFKRNRKENKEKIELDYQDFKHIIGEALLV